MNEVLENVGQNISVCRRCVSTDLYNMEMHFSMCILSSIISFKVSVQISSKILNSV